MSRRRAACTLILAGRRLAVDAAQVRRYCAKLADRQPIATGEACHAKTPFLLVQGADDLLTTPDITRRYFDSVSAPHKELVLVPRAGHEPNQLMVDAQLKILNQRVRPLARD